MDESELKEIAAMLSLRYSDVDIVEGDILFNDEDGNGWAISVSAV